MAGPGRLLLAARDFPRQTGLGLQRLLADSGSADTLLVGEDLSRVPAHRAVLTMASPFLASLLRDAGPSGHTVLYLGGLAGETLTALVTFIYLGKVEVGDQDAGQFAKMLRDFQVLGQHLGEGKSGLEEGPLSLKEEYDSEYDEDMKGYSEDDEEEWEEEGEGGVVEPHATLKALLAAPSGPPENDALLLQAQAESPIKHSREFLEKKVARQKALTCAHCTFRARDFSKLQTHTRRFHENEWPCDRCGLVLRTEGRLKKHIRCVHESARSQNKCDQCDHEATCISLLNIHKRKAHGGEKYYCDQCPYSSWINNNVKRHKESKHEGKRYQCDQCEASYPHVQGMRRHKAIAHEGKRVQCPHCDYKATTNSNLKIHVLGKHEGKRFWCDICDWSGSQEGSLNIHKRQKHGFEHSPKVESYLDQN